MTLKRFVVGVLLVASGAVIGALGTYGALWIGAGPKEARTR